MAVRFVLKARKSRHITLLLQELDWQPIENESKKNSGNDLSIPEWSLNRIAAALNQFI